MNLKQKNLERNHQHFKSDYFG